MPVVKDITGQKFNRLTPLRRVGNKPIKWECRCDCGNIIIATLNHITQGNTTSCGCRKSEITASFGESSRKRPYESIYNTFAWYSRKRQGNVEISYEQFLTFTEITHCHYCDVDIQWVKYNRKYAYFLDRKDNALGYTMNNVVVCCGRCNLSRADRFTYEEWIEIGKTIRKLREDSRENYYKACA